MKPCYKMIKPHVLRNSPLLSQPLKNLKVYTSYTATRWTGRAGTLREAFQYARGALLFSSYANWSGYTLPLPTRVALDQHSHTAVSETLWFFMLPGDGRRKQFWKIRKYTVFPWPAFKAGCCWYTRNCSGCMEEKYEMYWINQISIDLSAYIKWSTLYPCHAWENPVTVLIFPMHSAKVAWFCPCTNQSRT